jgi:hypothetical protein
MQALFLLSTMAGVAAWAQPITVYSEFARIDPKTGDALAPESPREILSPAVVRNGFTSFQVVVQAPAEDKWWLFVGQNPENAFKLTLFKESGDSLERVDLPYQSTGTQVFWLDVWTDGNAPVRRVKLEPELNLHDDWVIYPIEARVVDAIVPETPGIENLVCGLKVSAIMATGSTHGVAGAQLRNAEQDGALATKLLKDELENLGAWCDTPAPSDAQRFWTESYLRIRDYLFRLR